MNDLTPYDYFMGDYYKEKVLNRRADFLNPGDRATWVWIALMCLVGLALAFIAYILPAGQGATPPPIRLY